MRVFCTFICCSVNMLLSGTHLIFTPDMVTALNLTVGLSDQDVRSKNAITCRLGLEVVETCMQVNYLLAQQQSYQHVHVRLDMLARLCARARAHAHSHRFREFPKTIVSSKALTTFQLYVLILLIKQKENHIMTLIFCIFSLNILYVIKEIPVIVSRKSFKFPVMIELYRNKV